MKKKESEPEWSEKLEKKLLPPEGGKERVSLTLIIPTYNCSELIGKTLQSLQAQNYPSLELIIIDAGSTDRTIEVVGHYSSIVTRIYTVTHYNVSEMMNRGISMASGRYISFLFAGSSYISTYAYQDFASEVLHSDYPDLVYCGSTQRELRRMPHTVHLPFDKKILQKGEHPATLPACWFRADLFDRVGRFRTQLVVRPGFDFFCRIAALEGTRIISIDRTYIDFDFGLFTYGRALRYAGETFQILWSHHGMKRAMLWFFTINHMRMLKWVYRNLKHHLFQS